MHTKIVLIATLGIFSAMQGISRAGELWGLGNHWGLGSTSLILDADNERYAFRFTAQDSITVDTAHMHLNSAGAFTDVELCADDGTGLPGAVLATATIPSTGGGNWQAALSSSVNLAQGSIYHYVVARNGAGTIAPRIGSPGLSNHDSLTGTFDPNMTLLGMVNNATNYTDQGTSLSWRYGFSSSSTGDAVGHPYDTLAAGNQSEFGEEAWKGQSFVVPDDWFVNSISVKIAKLVTDPGDDVRVRVVRASDNTEIYWDTLVSPGDLGTNAVFETVSVNIPPLTLALAAGETYRIMLESVGSGYREYQMLASRATAAQGNLQNANFQGDLGQLVQATSATTNLPAVYSSVDFSDLRHDAYFVLDVVPSTVEISGIVVEETAAIQFESDPGIAYRLQYGTDLVVTNWIDAGFTIEGDGGLLNAYDPAGFSTQKTYRLTFAP